VAREPRLSAATNMTGGAPSAPRVFGHRVLINWI
jgi:hypothetical protein